MDALVGHSGFVGSNLKSQHRFAALFNSRNASEIAERRFKRLVCSALPASMWLANNDPDADRANMLQLAESLEGVAAEMVILISTIAVYRDASQPVDELQDDFETKFAYGQHRREFEERIARQFESHLIVRLPALIGANLKKNFIFDILNPVPSFLTEEALKSVRDNATPAGQSLIEHAFSLNETTGMWCFNRDGYGHGSTGAALNSLFEGPGTSALQFTHADSTFQFYNLDNLWRDIERAEGAGLRLLNLTAEPLRAGDIYSALRGRDMTERVASQIHQDMRSRYSSLWDQRDGYLYGQNETLADIKRFAENWGAATP